MKPYEERSKSSKISSGNDANILIWEGLRGNERWHNSEGLPKFCYLPPFLLQRWGLIINTSI